MLLDAAELLGKKYGTAELDRLVAQYCDAYYGIYGVIDASMSEDEATDIYMKYLEEICADAYAQIRRGGINIAKAEAAMETYRTDTQKQTAAATERTNGPGQQGKYSVNNEFEAAIDQWTADGSPDGMSFILGSTGDVLQGLGAIESDIYMQGDKIKTILRKHLEMSMDEIKKIPQILDDPVLILKSRNTGRNSSQNTRLVVFGTVKAQSGKPVLSVLDLRPSEGRMLIDDMQIVNSAYVKGNDPVGFVRRSEVLYADKKRTNQLLRWIGFQAPTELLRHGSMGSIAYEGNDVKIFGKDFSEVVHEAATAEDYTGDVTTANSSKGERQKYSFGGEKARSANIEALREAQEMYDILNLQPTSFTEKETDAAITVNPSPGVGRNTASISAESVAQNAPSVKQKYSMEDGTRYSIGEIIGDEQKDYGIGVHLDSTLLENLTSKERTEMVKERVKELGGEVFTAYDSAGNAADISIAKPEDRFKNRYGKSKPVNKDLTTKYISNKTKQEAVVLLDELITTAKHLNSEASRYSHDWLDDDGKNNWDYWTTYVQDKKGTIWEATLNVANTANGEKILYDISPIKKVGQSVKSDTSLLSTGQPVKSGTSTVDASIAERETSVKQKYSLEDDTRELDAGYRRAVEKDAAENEPTGGDEGLLPEKKRGGTDYAELATEEIERRANRLLQQGYINSEISTHAPV